MPAEREVNKKQDGYSHKIPERLRNFRFQGPLKMGVLNATKNCKICGLPGGAVVGSLPANAGDTGSSPGLGRSHMPWSN